MRGEIEREVKVRDVHERVREDVGLTHIWRMHGQVYEQTIREARSYG
jgi:hypothetical protein